MAHPETLLPELQIPAEEDEVHLRARAGYSPGEGAGQVGDDVQLGIVLKDSQAVPKDPGLRKKRERELLFCH